MTEPVTLDPEAVRAVAHAVAELLADEPGLPAPAAGDREVPTPSVVGTGEGVNSRCVRVWCVQTPTPGTPIFSVVRDREGAPRARRPPVVEPSEEV